MRRTVAVLAVLVGACGGDDGPESWSNTRWATTVTLTSPVPCPITGDGNIAGVYQIDIKDYAAAGGGTVLAWLWSDDGVYTLGTSASDDGTLTLTAARGWTFVLGPIGSSWDGTAHQEDGDGNACDYSVTGAFVEDLPPPQPPSS